MQKRFFIKKLQVVYKQIRACPKICFAIENSISVFLRKLNIDNKEFKIMESSRYIERQLPKFIRVAPGQTGEIQI